jgi:carbon monoxide dehydrogenase subunit G
MHRTDRVVPDRVIGAGQRAAAALLAGLALWPACSGAQPIDVRVEKRGELVVVDVEATVAAPLQQAWAVLTDYDHMASYLSMLKSSAIVAREGNTLQVEQTGEAQRAFLHFTFRSLRSVELVPEREIRSHLISGDFKSYAFTTRIAAKGGQTQISHHGEYVPTRWVPPGIGPALIKGETTRQYEELIAEMLRRERAAAPGGPAASTPAR